MNTLPSLSGDKKETPTLGGQSAVEKASAFLSSFAASNNALSTALLGRDAAPSEAYFPGELAGGCSPHVSGQEDEMAWQAGAEAVDSERLHYVWSVHDGTLWYLAVRSADLSSHVGTWCPFAALLPGMSGALAMPVVYIHTTDEAATMMTVAPHLLQVHRGAAMVIQAKAEKMARDLGGAQIVAITGETAEQLTPVPWKSASRMEDRARRFLATIGVFLGLAVAATAFVIWVLASLTTLAVQSDVTTAQANAAQAGQQLLAQASNLRVSALRVQTAKFVEVNESLLRIGGWLKEYKISGSSVRWTAVLPPGVTAEKISELGGRTKEVTNEGIIVEGGS